MADITKVLEPRAVVFVAETRRADQWMQQRFGMLTQRFGKHAIAFRADKAEQRESAAGLEVDAAGMDPALNIETVTQRVLIAA